MLATLLFPAGLALAAGGGTEHHGPNWWMLGLQVLNTLVLGFILVRYGGPALRDFFRQRADGIRTTIEGAQEQLQASEAEMSELRQRLDGFEAEAAGLLANAVSTAEAESGRVIERADATAERIREDARRVADSEIERARQELRAEASRLSIELAGELLREQTSDDDDARLVSEFTDKIGGSA
jgi:F-type H+-transporting ATPase subunit b